MKYFRNFFYVFKNASLILLFTAASLITLSHFGYLKTIKPYIVQSGSMEPSIPTGSVIFSLHSKLYQPGDIITFFANGDPKTVVTHRLNFKIFKDNQTIYITSGDANEDFDKWEVRYEHIVGKVVAIIPHLGHVIDFAKTPQGFIALVVVPATIVIYEELKNLLREIGKLVLAIKIFFKKKKEENSSLFNFAKSVNLNRIFVFVPILGVFVFITANSGGYFLDTEKSAGNVIGVATSYNSPTITPTNSNSPSPTISPTSTLPPTNTITATATPTTTPTISPMVKLNEAAPATNPEWVEIYNTYPTADFLKNYWLDDDTSFTSDSGNSPKVLMSSLDTSNTLFPTIDLTNPIFNNTGDFIVIFDNLGNLVDSVNYTSNFGTKSIGREIDGTGIWKFPCANSTKGASNNTKC
ncbi:MAG: signal peptidase I [Patescibacteria group bacterium]|nr:signal peptidase I [Patescibacteria group bacterium]